MGYSPWGCKELDTTERLTLSHTRLNARMFVIGHHCICIIVFIFSWICGRESLKYHQKTAPDGIPTYIILFCKGENLSIELFTEKEVGTRSKSYLYMQAIIYKLMLMVVANGLGDFSAFIFSFTFQYCCNYL